MGGNQPLLGENPQPSGPCLTVYIKMTLYFTQRGTFIDANKVLLLLPRLIACIYHLTFQKNFKRLLLR